MRTVTTTPRRLGCPLGGVRVIFPRDSRSWRTWGRLTRGPRKVIGIMVLSLLYPAVAGASPRGLGPDDRAQLASYARDTWRSIDLLGLAGVLPADVLHRDRSADRWVPAGPTSPSNIAAYLWSVVAAETLGLIDANEARNRLERTLSALARLERANGFFYNWYEPDTGARSLTWPGG